MPHLDDAQKRVAAAIDRESLVEFLSSLVAEPSPTGREEGAALVVARKLAELGVDTEIQRFAPGRANVIGRLRGTGDGPAVMLNGHLDTSYTGEEEELSGIGYKNTPHVVDGQWMYGNGVHNMKSALASYVAVIDALRQTGVTLAGDVVVAAVAGEIEKAPYGRYQGAEYEGFGTGTGYALAHGLTADMCILGEPTSNAIGLSNLGILWARIRVHGTMAHTQHAEHAINAIARGRRLMDVLDAWGAEYRERNLYEGLRPAVDITAIEGGWPYRLSRTPVFCDVFLCVRIPPVLYPIQVERELRKLLRSLEPEIGPTDMQIYVSHGGAAIDKDEPVVQAVDLAHTELLGEPPSYNPRGSYMDSSHLVHLGIPTVVYGPSGRVRTENPDAGWAPAEGEHTYIDDIVDNARVVAAAVVSLCGVAETAEPSS